MTESNENLESRLPGDMEKHGQHYNETDFWQKLQNLPKSAIGKVLEKALLLRELLFDGATPLWVKGSIVGVLGYLILPIDMIPDLVPGVGFVDDVAAMTLVLAGLDAFVTDDVRRRARERLPSGYRPDEQR